VVAVTGVGAGVAATGVATSDAGWTRDAADGDAVGRGIGAAVMTPAGGLEDGDVEGVGVGLAEAVGGVPRVAPGVYHCRLPKGTGSASRSRASGTSLVVKGSLPSPAW
jgi:hypothetical protein